MSEPSEPDEPALARDATTGRFVRGHKGIGGRPGRDRETRRKMRSLAIVLRENWPPEQIAWWLREVVAGRDPDRPESTAPIDWAIRMRAARMYLERALGMPAQSIHLEAQVAAADEPPLPGPDAFAALAPEARLALRSALAALLAQRPAAEPESGSGSGPGTGARGAWNRHVRHVRGRLSPGTEPA